MKERVIRSVCFQNLKLISVISRSISRSFHLFDRLARVYTLVFRHLLFQPLHLSALSANEMWRRRGSGDNSPESDQISDGQSSSNEVQEVAVDTYRITTLQGLASRCCANLGKDQWPWYLSKQATQDHLWRYSLWRGHPWAGQMFTLAEWAIRINPWNVESTAEAMNEAIFMAEYEKQLRHEIHYRFCQKRPTYNKKLSKGFLYFIRGTGSYRSVIPLLAHSYCSGSKLCRCLFGLWLPNSIISTGEKMKCYRDVLRMFVVVVGPMQLYFLSKREDVKPPFLPRNPSR
ncbi:hypothetical protein DCAR_0311348 [Daucus carota subsp. sativus]|uniref:Uncharacterized protein n=1 Tax=Daucus carota subsp. sativus TaxID=79200 RepID=A0A161XXE6_DAUCS|nr:hypothetical protein DCAR_0311348 [Daucus carota subsp. sativus]